MNINEIRNSITFKESNWSNFYSTNCYAYALGLDISESLICKNAYVVGTISMNYFNIPIEKINNMSYEDRLLLDLNTLNLDYSFQNPNDIKKYDDIINKCHFISMYIDKKDKDNFHFIRKSIGNDYWMHKLGYIGLPTKLDLDCNIITNPINANLGNYKYIKTLKIK